MKRSKFSEEQITFALRQHDAGTPVEEVVAERDLEIDVMREIAQKKW